MNSCLPVLPEQKVDLSFGAISPEAHAASLENIVGDITWSSLHQVAFRRFNVPARHFLSFLKKHEDALRGVVLEDVCRSATRNMVKSLVRSSRSKRTLEALSDRGSIVSKGSRRHRFLCGQLQLGNGPHAAQMIEDYVMRKTDFDPLTPATVNEENRRDGLAR